MLVGRPWWDVAAFDWVKDVEASCGVIKEELLGLRGVKGGFRPFRQPSWAAGVQLALIITWFWFVI
jgi:hypothetical protein